MFWSHCAYPKDSKYYSLTKAKLIAKFKKEAKSKIITEFFGLRPKMQYSLYDDNIIHKIDANLISNWEQNVIYQKSANVT